MKRVFISLALLVFGCIFVLNGCDCGRDSSSSTSGLTGAVADKQTASVPVKIGFPRKGLILNHYGEVLSRTNILEKNFLSGVMSMTEDDVSLRTAVFNNNLDVALMSDFQAVLALGADFNGFIAANLGSLGQCALMVLPDSPVQKLSDLKGKGIGLALNTPEHLALLGWLKREGIQDGRDVELVNIGDSEKLSSLKTFKIDAMVATDPKVQEYIGQGICRNIYDSHNYGVVLISGGFYKQQPQAAARFVTALREAMLFMSTHKPDVNNWIKGYCGIEEDLIWRVSGINMGYFNTRKINDAKVFLSDAFVGHLKNLAAYTLQQQLTYKTLIINDLIAPELQEEGRKEVDAAKYDPSSVKVKN